jgi:hypothetical protein
LSLRLPLPSRVAVQSCRNRRNTDDSERQTVNRRGSLRKHPGHRQGPGAREPPQTSCVRVGRQAAPGYPWGLSIIAKPQRSCASCTGRSFQPWLWEPRRTLAARRAEVLRRGRPRRPEFRGRRTSSKSAQSARTSTTIPITFIGPSASWELPKRTRRRKRHPDAPLLHDKTGEWAPHGTSNRDHCAPAGSDSAGTRCRERVVRMVRRRNPGTAAVDADDSRATQRPDFASLHPQPTPPAQPSEVRAFSADE